MLCAEHVLICQCQTCYNCHIWRQYNRAERINDLYSFSMHERGKIHLIFWMISKRLLHFLQISLIWSVHDILLLNRCLWTVTSLIAVFFFDIMADTLDVQIFFLEIMRNSVFDALNVTIHCFDHSFKVSKSWFNF
jgi:hypothetical protein